MQKVKGPGVASIISAVVSILTREYVDHIAIERKGNERYVVVQDTILPEKVIRAIMDYFLGREQWYCDIKCIFYNGSSRICLVIGQYIQ